MKKHLALTIYDFINEQNSLNLYSNFWKWFGDSKVVDISGNPLIVYHGTDFYFDIFDKSKFNKNESSGDYIGAGFYFSSSKSNANKYGKSKIISAYLKIENPLVINNYDEFMKYMTELFGIDVKYNIPKYYILKKESPLLIFEKIKDLGYDGLIDNLYHQYAVFEPNQIKAINNDGSWNIDDDNIYS